MLASEPDPFDVDGLSEIPDLLRGVNCIGIFGVHYACIVKHNIYAAPVVKMVNESFDIGFFRDIADL